MTLKLIRFKELVIPNLMEEAGSLTKHGELVSNDNHFTCLNINDDYIHKLYPYFFELNSQIIKPDYFDDDSIGAHITVFYPEENIILSENNLGQLYRFSLSHPFSADLGNKRYFGVQVTSPELIEIRRRYGLSKKLQFKRYLIDLHITIGIINL